MNVIDLKEGQKAKVISFIGGENAHKKLENMGIRIGTIIQNLNAQRLKGPVVVQFSRTQVAMGRGMAEKIIVEKI